VRGHGNFGIQCIYRFLPAACKKNTIKFSLLTGVKGMTNGRRARGAGASAERDGID
jgi:hypothetical protein